MINKKSISIVTLISLSIITLSGCSSIENQAFKFILGEQFVQANDGLNHCDVSGIPYLEKQAHGDNDFMASASSLTLGAHYASIGNQYKVNEMATLLSKNSKGKTSFSEAKKELIEGGKKTEQDRINNGLSPTCHQL